MGDSASLDTMNTQQPTSLRDDDIVEESSQDEPWWKDPSLPWEHAPTRADLWCWGLLAAYGIWGLVMMPLRPLLLARPLWAVIINGSRMGMASVGALAAVSSEYRHWLIALLLIGAISSMKWSLVMWWGGTLWGKTMIDLMTEQRPRWRARAHRVGDFASRHPFWALAFAYAIPQVSVFVYIALGIAGMRLRRFVAWQLLWSILTAASLGTLGFLVGAPAVHWLRLYADVAFYIALAMMAAMFFMMWRRSRAAKASSS